MRRNQNHIRFMFAVFATAITSCVIMGMSWQARSNASTAAPVPIKPAPVAAAAALPVDPALTDIARQIKACPEFEGATRPGEILRVNLSLPRELNGTGECSSAAGRTGRPRPVVDRRPVRPVAVTRTSTVARPTASPIGRGVFDEIPITRTIIEADSSGPGATATDIPCEALPTGCPPPVTSGGATFRITSVNVKWGVYEAGRELNVGADYALPKNELSAEIVMAPLQIAELKASPLPLNKLTIRATVTLVADKTIPTPPGTTQVTSGEVPIDVPEFSLLPLEAPKVFVLFLNKNFRGAAAIYLPERTWLADRDGDEQELFDAVGGLLNSYNSVASNLKFVSWFGSYLTGLEALRLVGNLPYVDIKERKDGESNLNDDDFIDRGVSISPPNDTEVEDESSALLLLGPPATKVQFFQDRGFSGGEFDVQTSSVGGAKPPTDYAPAVLIRDFDAVTASVPPSKVSIVKKFMITFTGVTVREVTPNDRLSSFRWVN